MSIRKTFIIDSNNRSRGDESVFEIDIDKNYFNKVPNSIKLINTTIPIAVEFINETNNKVRIEKIDKNLKVVSFIDIEFSSATNINTADELVNKLNERLQDRMLSSQLFGNVFLQLKFVSSVRVDVSINAYTDIPYPTVSNKLVFPYNYDYFVITPSSSNFNDLELAVNFNIDSSIGPLLGFGTKRLVPANSHLFKFDESVPTSSTTVFRFVKPVWYNGTSFFKSENKLLDYKKINNLNIENKDTIYINMGGQIAETEFPFTFNTQLNNQLLAERLTNDIRKTTIGTDILTLYGFGAVDYSNIDVSYIYKQRQLNIVAASIYTIDVNFGSITNTTDNSMANIFKGLVQGQTETTQLGNATDGTYRNISSNRLIEFLNPNDVALPVVNSNNNALNLKGSLSTTFQKFRAPWNNVIEDVYQQNLVPFTLVGNGITAVNCVYNEDDIMPNTVFSGEKSTRVISSTLNSNLTIDGSNLIHGDIVLINTVNNKILNGVYVFNNNGLTLWELRRIYNYDGSNINTSPNLNDFIYVNYKSVYYGSPERNNIKYENTIFALTFTNKPPANPFINVDVDEIYFTPVYGNQTTGNTIIPFPVDFISSWDSTFNAGFGGGTPYAVIAPEIVNPSDGPLLINGVPTKVNELILIDQTVIDTTVNGIYVIKDVGSATSPWRLRRLNAPATVKIVKNTDTIFNNKYIGLERNYEDDIIANSTDLGLTKGSGGTLSVDFVGSPGPTAVNLNDIIFINNLANPLMKRYNGYYTCIDNGSNIGDNSDNWKIQRINTVDTELLFDDGLSSYHVIIGLRNNNIHKLSAYKIAKPTDYNNRKFKDRNQLLRGLSRVINTTYDTAFPESSYPTPLTAQNNTNKYKRLGNVVNLTEESSGSFNFKYNVIDTPPVVYNPLTRPIFKLKFNTNNIGFKTETKKGETEYNSDNIIQTNSVSSGSFSIFIPAAIQKTITLTEKNYINTSALVEALNAAFINSGTVGTDVTRVRVRYDNFNKYYTIYHLDNLAFTVDFTIQKSIGSTLGFNNSFLTSLSAYNGDLTLTIENATKPNNIYICSDLVDSIDSGSIIPLGGPTPVENVLFSIPNIENYDDISNMEVLINNSRFAQRFTENKFENNKIPIKFWLKLPNGVGFVKQPWYMRTELIFKTINE